MIDKIRKQTEIKRQEGEKLRQNIQEFDNINAKVRKDTKEQRDKSDKAISDKFEIMRDLATYEHNFAMEKGERDGLNLHERLSKAVHMI